MKKMTFFFILILSLIYIFSDIANAEEAKIGSGFLRIFDDHGAVMLLIDPLDGSILYANNAALEFYGYSKEQLESMKITDINTMNNVETEKEMQAAVSASRNSFTFSHRLANGEIKLVEVYSYPTIYNEREVLFSIIYDITEKYELEEKEKALTSMIFFGLVLFIVILLVATILLINGYRKVNYFNELRKTFIDSDDRLIYLKDENLRYVFVNKATEKFYNRDKSEIIGFDDYALSEKEFAEERIKTDREVLNKKSHTFSEVTWKNRVYKTNKFPIKLNNGKFGIGAYIEDVTEAYIHQKELKEHKDKLQLILDSAAEAIYGIDSEGRCTFCNTSCLEMLGYKDQSELIGKDMHVITHHSHEDGTPLPVKQCRIYQTLKTGEGTHVDDEVFKRADGSAFDVEYFSYPQFKDGRLIGAVVTFMDITKRKKAEENIKYLSYHDALTGLYNRMFFEEELNRINNKKNLPISIIMGDVNGLKLVNDVFGHAFGDLLLKKAAVTLRAHCRKDDIISRIGGDEFVVLLPKTQKEDAERIMKQIQSAFSREKIAAVKGSISMGCDTKTSMDQSILHVLEAAEDRMYQQKTLSQNNTGGDFIKMIMETLHMRSSKERKHSENVSEICALIGREMGLSDSEQKKLKEAGYYHDIGKITLDDYVLNESESLTPEDEKEIRMHCLAGYRILNSFEGTVNLAEAVLAHHERWNGSGYPKGLKGMEIPLEARIISVAETYDAMTNRKDMPGEAALLEINTLSGIDFDPVVVKAFSQVHQNMTFNV